MCERKTDKDIEYPQSIQERKFVDFCKKTKAKIMAKMLSDYAGGDQEWLDKQWKRIDNKHKTQGLIHWKCRLCFTIFNEESMYWKCPDCGELFDKKLCKDSHECIPPEER